MRTLNSFDKDGDGHVSETEYVDVFPEDRRPAANRDFRLFDRNADRELSADEYLMIPGAVPVTLRLAPPHPLSRLVDEQRQTLAKNWPDWDKDRNETLSLPEFDVDRIDKYIQPHFGLMVGRPFRSRQFAEQRVNVDRDDTRHNFYARVSGSQMEVERVPPAIAENVDFRREAPAGAT